MQPRIQYANIAPGAMTAMLALETYVLRCGLERSLIELVKLRASQINGCAYCVDMHTKDARAEGETEQRLYAVMVWEETPFFTERERAALAWTEAVTLVGQGHVPDDVYQCARASFSETGLVNLTLAIIAINGWNRLAISFRTVLGTYQRAGQMTAGQALIALQLKRKQRGRQPMTRSANGLRKSVGSSDKRSRTDHPDSKPAQVRRFPFQRRAKQPDQHPVVLTVGHSTRSLKEFVALLLAHGVNQLVDVRTIPRSRHNPQFNRSRLPEPLRKAGIRYMHMAGLGGLRHARHDSINTAWRNASFRGFADYMQTPEFEKALDQLMQVAQKRRTVIMCAEAVPWRCHRSLIGDALLVRGLRVDEIASPTRTRPHTLIPWARVRRNRLSYPASSERTKPIDGKVA